jgi:hypothetical protein
MLLCNKTDENKYNTIQYITRLTIQAKIHSVTITVHETDIINKQYNVNNEYFSTHTWKQNHRKFIDVST